WWLLRDSRVERTVRRELRPRYARLGPVWQPAGGPGEVRCRHHRPGGGGDRVLGDRAGRTDPAAQLLRRAPGGAHQRQAAEGAGRLSRRAYPNSAARGWAPFGDGRDGGCWSALRDRHATSQVGPLTSGMG